MRDVYRKFLIFTLGLALTVYSHAQEPAPAPDTDEAAPAEEAKPAGPEAPGDVLVLETGSRMTGVQVLRATPQFYEVEVVKGVVIQVPRRQVKDVIYDDVDPTRDKRLQELFPEQQEVTISSVERVTAGLRDKLMAPVSSEPLSYKNQDFVPILEELKNKLGFNLKIDPSVMELPKNQRNWTAEIPTDRTLLALLREDLVGSLNRLEVVFEGDKVIVTTKQAQGEGAPQAPVLPQF